MGTPGDGVKSADGEPMRLVEAATLCADERAVTEPDADVGEDPEAMRSDPFVFADTQATPPAGAFPSLDSPDERRMEEVLVARLFPQRHNPVTIGRYRVLDRLGHGGMGVVYSAYDLELDRRVAIKLLLADRLTTGAERRLRREAQAMAKVAHANVVSVIEVGEHGGQTFVVMEYIRGRSLSEWSAERRGWREVVDVFTQAGRGLAAAHRAGVIHRDFKPHNVMIVDEGPDVGRVKVLDFGLARAAELSGAEPAVNGEPTAEFAARLTATGALMGTPAYMAPEQLQGSPADERSDQYSFAASLYEALYAELPFKGDSLAALIREVLEGELPPPPSAAVPTRIHRLLVRALSRDPGARFESMSALCDALTDDPGATRRSFALAATLSVVVGAGAWGLGSFAADGADPCTGPTFELGGVWDDTRAAEVRASFAATGVPYAEEAATRTIRILDDYAGEWSAGRREACAEHQSGAISSDLLDLQTACLGRRRAGLSALSDLLREADPTTLERSTEAAASLPPIAACRDHDGLLGDPLSPREDALKGQVQGARERIARAVALASAGRLDDAAEVTAEIANEAESLGFLPLIAEAQLRSGALAVERRKTEEAERALSRAIAAALESGADRLAAEALIRRFYVRGERLGDAAGAAADSAFAAPLVARFREDPYLRWLYLNNLGVLKLMSREFAEARRLLEEASTIEDGPTPAESAGTLANLGIVARQRSDLPVAREHFRAARQHIERTLGPEHPMIAALVPHEANAIADLGRTDEARTLLRDLLSRPGSERSAHIGAWPRINLARLELAPRRYAEAQALAEAALGLLEPTDIAPRVQAEVVLAVASAGLGDAEEARLLREGALTRGAEKYGVTSVTAISALLAAARYADVVGDTEPLEARLRRALAALRAENRLEEASAAYVQCALANVLIGSPDPGEQREASELAASAAATLRSLEGDNVLDVGDAEVSRGRALFAVGEHASAAAALLGAIELLEPRVDADDPRLAKARVAAAKALLSRDRASEATPLLDSAGRSYAALGPAFAVELAEVEALRRGASR
ncbi:MAG: serine/threonine protein kinase [Myxococcales bacterium]|nr:serine/threonine protein kinase [Myxococcales bacterium]